MEDNTLIIFKVISNFVRDLNDSFGKKTRSLLLYSRLIEKTTIIHEGPIKKHVNSFKNFCIKNKNAILSKDFKLLNPKTVKYSDKVFINIHDILKIADKQEQEAIWGHILTISAYLDPSSKAKEILKNSMNKNKKNGGEGKEEEFLSNLIDKVETNVDPETTNPMDAVNSIMGSGIFTDLIGSMNNGLSDGSIDMSRLMGSVQNYDGRYDGRYGKWDVSRKRSRNCCTS